MGKSLKVILSGGGTGGHIFPAIAIANELKKLVPHVEILFVGALGKMEMEKVPSAGYKIIGIPIAGFQRNFSWANFKLPFLIFKSLLQTRKIIDEFKPDVVIGTGGYASGPLLKAATSKRVPTLLQEQNSYAGITNKILSKKATKICVAYDGMEKFFDKEKIVLTGNPVRQDILNRNINQDEAYQFFNLDKNKKTVLVIGGSLGARGINEAISLGLKQFSDHNIQLIWQTGKTYFEIAIEKLSYHSTQYIKPYDFIFRMDYAYKVADLVISRAGAGAISEICIVSKPSILIPLPSAAEDHQTKNAMSLVLKNAAVLIKESDAKNILIHKIISLLNNEEELIELSKNVGTLALPNSTHLIANEVLKLANYISS
jgi:UDP-N-acetylglucosamine--N-acetylmuramyl-(pentapeptide) pyrophosphoryl-undecaprenol N-acetylglucosamine transferase